MASEYKCFSVALTAEDAQRVDDFARREAAESGSPPNRARAIRSLLRAGLAQMARAGLAPTGAQMARVAHAEDARAGGCLAAVCLMAAAAAAAAGAVAWFHAAFRAGCEGQALVAAFVAAAAMVLIGILSDVFDDGGAE